MMRFLLVLVFLLLIGFCAIVLGLFFTKKHVKFPVLAALALVLSLLGGVLIFLTLKQGIRGALKVYLILAGAAPAAMVISVVLHNAISGLLTALLHRDFEEAAFFLIALFGCPAAFFVGAIGSIVMIIRSMIRA